VHTDSDPGGTSADHRRTDARTPVTWFITASSRIGLALAQGRLDELDAWAATAQAVDGSPAA
jgi:hypothetical protein